MIKREFYLQQLRKAKDTDLIKVITGIRRSGKSTLLQLFQDELLANQNVNENQIISINFEDPANTISLDWREIYNKIDAQLSKHDKTYVFLDEIQNIPEFEKLADGLFVNKNVDLYITGSNAYFLSSELATLLSGRYIEIQMLPLSFAEYLSTFADATDQQRCFSDFMTYGGFPYVSKLQHDEPSMIDDYLLGIYNSVILKDVVSRKNIGDPGRVTDITKFVFDNIGNTTTYKKIADTMKANNRAIDNRTVETYINALVDSFILYPIENYDIKGKKLLRTQKKYYIVDVGLRRALLKRDVSQDIGRILENVVFLELKKRGLAIFVGKSGSGEVDFMTRNFDGNVTYYQVAYTARGEETLGRELASLMQIKDHNPKYLLTMDIEPTQDYNGVKKVNVVDFLLEGGV
ncbi:ATP-binding protein [Candidatus Saccharibacteria bacterium]|nr:ATP-binding protein [Candidatus Saccharibacteria bacterium]